MDGSAGGSEGGPREHGLFRRERTKRSYSTMAEGHLHRDTSPDTLFVPQDDHYHNEHAAQRPRLSSRIALPPLRYPGDGLDHRRPIMTGSSSGSGSGSGSNGNTDGQAQNAGVGVIDLTSDDGEPEAQQRVPPTTGARAGRALRGPRFGRNIIDLEEDEDGVDGDTPRTSHAAAVPPAPRPNYLDLFPDRASTRTHPHPQFSSLRRPERGPPPAARREPRRIHLDALRDIREDLEGMRGLEADYPGLRTRMDDDLRRQLRAGGRPESESTRGHRSVTPYPNGRPGFEPIDLTGDDDDVVVVDARTRAGVNAGAPNITAGAGTRRGSGHRELLETLNAGTGRLFERVMAQVGIARPHAHAGRAHVTFGNPTAHPHAFAIDLDFGATAFDMGLGGNPPPPPKYEPPSAAAKGFTRSPGEDEVVVCPNCGDELAVHDDEKKAEVWVVKKCGHAYCGDCAQHRTKASRGKGKAPAHSKPMPFKECVVLGCREKVGAKAMMHIFIGS